MSEPSDPPEMLPTPTADAPADAIADGADPQEGITLLQNASTTRNGGRVAPTRQVSMLSVIATAFVALCIMGFTLVSHLHNTPPSQPPAPPSPLPVPAQVPVSTTRPGPPASPPLLPLLQLIDGRSTWRHFQQPLLPVPAAALVFWRDQSTSAAAAARTRLATTLFSWLSDRERGSSAYWNTTRVQWLPAGNTSAQAMISNVCIAIEAAIPHAGVNGLVRATLDAWRRLVTSQPVANVLAEHLPIRVDGTTVWDLNHLAGAVAMAAALRTPGTAAERAAAVESVIAIAAEAVAAQGTVAAQAAPLHAAVWQRAVSLAAGTSLEQYWHGALRVVCAPMLNRWSFVQCLHGVGHGAVKFALKQLDAPETDREGGTAAGSGREPTACIPVPRVRGFDDRALAAATRACDAAPGRGAAYACSVSLWMDVYDQHIPLGSWKALADLPPAPWLAIDLDVPAGALQPRAPCDHAEYPAACFARHFHKPLLAPRWRAPADGSAPYVPPAPLRLAADCVAQPMASESHVRGCVFGLSLNAYPLQLGTRGALAGWCSHFVERAARAGGTTTTGERARQTSHLLSCVAGSMFGLAFGLIGPERLPAWVVRSHCTSELAPAYTGGWLSADERAHTVRVCIDAGTLCSAAGSNCTDPTTEMWATVAPVLDADGLR